MDTKSFLDKQWESFIIQFSVDIGRALDTRLGLVAANQLNVIRKTDETESCEGCDLEFNIDTMRMDSEDGNWWCKNCLVIE